MRGKKGVMVMALFPAHFSTYLVPLNTIRLVFNRCLFPHKKKLKERKKWAAAEDYKQNAIHNADC